MQLITILSLIGVANAGLHRGSSSLRVTKITTVTHLKAGDVHREEPIEHDPDQPFGILEENKKFQFPWPYTIDDERCPTGWWKVKCVKDTAPQKYWYHEQIPSEDQEPISIKVCGNWCKGVKGSQFFGVENGDKCYCTPYFHDTNKGGNGRCDMPCVGDNAELCGGQYMTDIYQLHDCNNLPPVPCKVPPAMVPFAKTFKSRVHYYKSAEIPCANAVDKPLTNVEALCHVECLPGYDLKDNTLKCSEKGNRLTYSWAQFEGSAECTPKVCGPPPDGPHTRHLMSPVVFPNTAEFNCQLGYTLNQKAAGAKDFEIFCTEDGTFSKLKLCDPVICSKGDVACPTGEKYEHANPVEKLQRTYGMPCTYNCDPGYTLDQQAGGEKQFRIVCLATGEFEEPQKCMPVTCGPPPKIANADIKGIEDTDDAIHYPEIVDYKCDKGYTLDQTAKGETAFNLKCTKKGTFTKKPECKPVLCGAPPMVANSHYPTEVLVFKETVTYVCEVGYSLDGKAEGKKLKTIGCGPDGQYDEEPPTCKPVECGDAPTIDFGKTEVTGMVVFSDEAVEYQCEPGYSTLTDDDPYDPKMTAFVTLCRADGSFKEHPKCKNIDDCLVHDCGPHGTCIDIEEATDKPFDNYKCKCEEGWEETLQLSSVRDEKSKFCTPINDCPVPLDSNCGGRTKDNKRRGGCTDIHLDYTCSCRSGYKMEYLEDKPKNQTCMPVVCGPVPEYEHAKSSHTDVANYDTPTWKWTCDTGYTLDGTNTGETTFKQHCGRDATFSAPKPCLPVTCGPPLSVAFSDQDPKVDTIYFPEEVVYTCEEGYSLNAKPDGKYEFTVKCQDNGRKTDVKECKPVECGGVPEQRHATYTKDKVFVFQEKATIKCDEGFSIDQTTNPESASYVMTCEAMGEYSGEKECKRIKCPEVPDVEHAKKDDSAKVFEDKAEYILDEGYSLNGKADGPTKFTIKCLSDATFSPGKEIKPVSCGKPPSRPHSTTPSAEYVFKQEAPHTCLAGYSVDGSPEGPTEYHLECEASGEFSGPDGCKPVECGDVVVPENSEQVKNPDGKKLPKLHFQQKGHFKCKPGFSLDGTLRGPLTFTTRCQADGTISAHVGCLNMNDCEGNQCGENGKCVDHEEPTGEHKDDYHCDCDSGFEEEVLDDGTRICANVPDCPEGACLPGSCQDLVNDYECHCPEGYYQGENPEEELPHDCLPNKCGKPPSIDHATTDKKGEDIFFNSDPVPYKCKEGYTLDGAADGDTTFEITCLASKDFSELPECKPVVCGEAPPVENSDFEKEKVYYFPDKIPYECEDGYSVDGKASGKKKFKGKCQADGEITDVLQCLPVECPAIPPQTHASFPAETQLFFPHEVEVTCLPGYAIEDDKHDKIKYEIKCKDDGKLDIEHDGCVPITCGDAPEVDHSTHEGEPIFGKEITYTAKEGYSLDGSSAGGKQFKVRCKANGEFSAVSEFMLIACGPPPVIPHAEAPKIDGNYMDLLQLPRKTRKTKKGLKTTKTKKGLKTKAHNRTKHGKKRKGKKHSKAHNDGRPTWSLAYAAANHVYHKANGTHIRRKAKNRRDISAKFGDVIEYECEEGYGVDENGDGFVDPDEEDDFEMHCDASGEIKPGEAPGEDVLPTECLPVRCELPGEGMPEGDMEHPPGEEEIDDEVKSFPIFPEGEPAPITFGMKQAFACAGGYTLDGKVAGATEYEETCEADGDLTDEHKCKKIDWCELSECGEHGKCEDGAFGYTCKCDDGFKTDLTEKGLETCVQIDECDTMGGEGFCTEHGKCIDETLKYKCECDDGYENEETEDGLDSCAAVICGEAPELDHAATPMKGIKISYPDSAPYSCASGYSLDGTPAGVTSFEVKCEADKEFSGEEECKPLECGDAVDVEHSEKNMSKVKYPEVVGYKCDKGYTTSGMANGMVKFSASCTADGVLTDAAACKPIRCGKPIAVLYARFPLNNVFYGDKVEYVCEEGFTTTGEADGDSKFKVDCEETGKFSDPERCMPVSCGIPKMIENSVMPIQEFTFPMRFTVACEAGHTVNEDPDGESTFVVKCMKDGKFDGLQDCKKVTCGKPQNTEGAETSDDEKFFEDTAEWKCKTGYTTDGKPKGKTSFVKQCGPDGVYGDSAPADCIDIDFCHGNPCGKNGLCIDSGKGKIDPGYECECHEGYEVKEGDKGPTCGADDCAGSPCGEGGTCFDLSKKEPPGPEGAYTCECEDGYELIEPEKDKYSCKRSECGPVTKLDNLEMDANGDPVIEVETWSGDDPTIDTFTGLPVLKSFDAVTYTCKEGYSTDGGTGPESKSFSISCMSTGILERPLNPKAECQPVKCANFMLPTVPNTIVTNAKESFFEFGDMVNFKCLDGFSTNKKPDGPKTFEMPCQKNGKFPSEHDNCKPISCGKAHEIENTLRSTTKKLTYHQGVTYTCSDGYTLDGEPGGESQFPGQCEASGKIEFLDEDGGYTPEPECVAVSCGAPPQIPNALLELPSMEEGPMPDSFEDMMFEFWAKKHAISKATPPKTALISRRARQPMEGPPMEEGGEMPPIRYRDPDVVAMCMEGFTVDGIPNGQLWFTMRCKANGEFTNADKHCEMPKFKVDGVATDAQSAAIKLKNCRVEIKAKETGKILADVNTDVSGFFSVLLPQGEVEMTASKPGYINQVKSFTVTSSIRRGQGADVSLSKVLPPDAWRAVVSWEGRSRDIDSHTYFGAGEAVHAYWPRRYRSMSAPGTGGIVVDLDRDDVNGFGPETTTFKNVGKCKTQGNCLIKFKIKNYSYRDKALGDSKVKIVLYNGDKVHSTYEIPPSVGDAKSAGYFSPIFTIDATEGASQRVYEGDLKLPSYMTFTRKGEQNWWGSLDYQTWSKVPNGAFLFGMYTTGGNRIFNIEMGHYYRVQNWKKMTCKNQNWWGSFDRQGWSTCDAGWFMAGLYRTGHMRDWAQGTYQIEEAWCCKADDGGYGKCEEHSIFNSAGWSDCKPIDGKPSAMVGLWRSNQGDIRGIDKAKCCTMP